MPLDIDSSHETSQRFLSNTSGAEEAPEFQLTTVWRTLRRNLWLILGLSCLGIALGLAASVFASKLYTATATIEVNKQSGSSVGVESLTGVREQFGTSEEMQASLLTEQSELESATVGLDVIERLGLSSLPPYNKAAKESSSRGSSVGSPEQRARERVFQLFESRLKVALIKDTRLIDVSFTDADPQRAALIANTVIDAYVRTHSEARSSASARTSALLAAQLADLRSQVLVAEKRVSDYKEKTGIVGANVADGSSPGVSPSADSVVVDRFIELNRNLTAAQVARVQRQAVLDITNAQDADAVIGALSTSLANSPSGSAPVEAERADLNLLTSLRQLRSELAVRVASRSNLYGKKSPEIAEPEAEIAEIDAQIKTEMARIHRHAESDYNLASATETGLQHLISAQQQKVTSLAVNSNQLALLEQEANSKRLLYQDLYAKLEQANISNGVDSSSITVVDPARAPIVPSSPKVMRNLAIGLVTGALLGVFVAFLLDYTSDRLFTLEEVQQFMPIPVLGSIPLALPPGGRFRDSRTFGRPDLDDGGSAIVLKEPNSRAAEGFRGLRNSLLLPAADAPRLIMFTSPASKDGKTIISFNTAIAFALQGAKVLLVEADLRRPRLQQMAGVAGRVGLGQYLQGEGTLEDAIVSFPQLEKLDLLVSGPPSALPSELLGSDRFTELMNVASKRYDYVLITTPPLLLVSDAVAVAPHVDLSVVIVRSGRTTRHMLRQALAKLGGLNTCLLVNGAANARNGYRLDESGYYAKATT